MSSIEGKPDTLLAAARQEMFSGNTGPDSPMSLAGRQAAEHAHQVGDARTEALAQFYGHHHGILTLPFDQAEARIAALQRRCDELGEPIGGRLLQITRANLYCLHRRYVESLDIAVRLERRHMAAFAPIEQAALLFVLIISSRAGGHFDQVVDYASRSLAVADASNQVYAMAGARGNYGGVLMELALDAQGALGHLEMGLKLLRLAPACPAYLQLQSIRIQALGMLGRHDEALRIFRQEFSGPDAAARGRDTRAATVTALLGMGLLDEAEAWLGEPPAVADSDHAWRRQQAYRRARMQLLCAQKKYAQARAWAEAEIDTPRNYATDPMYEMRMQDLLREACIGLGDHEAALAAAVAARQAALPAVRLSGRARYLVAQLKDGDKQLADLSPIDFRRLAEIDRAVQDAQAVSPAPLESPSAAADPAPADPAAAQRIPRFLAHVVHELRTPIGGVMGMASLLKASPLDERQSRYATLLESSAKTLLSLVNDVLDLAKLERGQFTLEPRPVAVRPWLQETLSPFEPMALLQQVVVSGTIDEHVPAQLCFDELRLRQVLSNLIANAVKFTRSGTVKVHLGLLETTPDGRCTLRVEVQDTGSGIAADEVGGLFQEFAQANASVSRQHGGTGLGLALCKQLVDRMGGRIGVHSVLGKGSTFWFELTLAVPHGDGGRQAEATLRGAS